MTPALEDAVVGKLLDALLEILELDFLFVRVSGSTAPGFTMGRRAESSGEGAAEHEIDGAINSLFDDARPTAPARRVVIGGIDVPITTAEVRLQDAVGVAVAGCRRIGFPAEHDRVLLNAAAHQAVSALHEVQLARVPDLVAELKRAEAELRRAYESSRIAEETLRERERESRLIVDSIPGLVATMTPTGELEGVNGQVLRYFDRTLDELKVWAHSDLAHPEDLPRVVEIVGQSIASGDSYEFEERIRRFDGEYRWFQVRGLPLRDSSGRIVRWYSLLTDIDERKRAEEALRASERQFRLLVETIPAIVWRGTAAGELDYLNERAVKYFGHSATSLTSGRWLELVHPDHRDATVQRWMQSVTTGSSYDDVYKLRRADGQYRWIQSVGEPFRDAEDRIVYWYGVVIDIDDRRQAEDQLHRNEAFLAEGMRLSATGTFTWRWDTGEITLSDELRRIYEVESHDVTLERLARVVHPEDLPRLGEIMQAIQATRAPWHHDQRLLMPDGRVKYLRTSGHVIRREDGHFEAVGATQDVTQRRVAEEALDKLRSEMAHVTRIMSLGALTASIAHEVNQPLSGIITNASTCLRMLDADPPNIDGARETTRRTIRDGDRAADVVRRLRALFSKKDFALEPLDLNEATREIIALTSNELQRNRIVLQWELAEDLPNLIGDRVQLQQVILNLLRNAADAMLGVDDRPRQLLVKTEREPPDRVRVTVRDSGVGFDRDVANKLFDAFYTTKPEGMGMGLSVSRSIIERHHGQIIAASNADGPGATFSFLLPVSSSTLTIA